MEMLTTIGCNGVRRARHGAGMALVAWLLSGCALPPSTAPEPPTRAPAAAQPSAPESDAAASAPMTASVVPAEAQQRYDQALAAVKNGQIPAATSQLQKLAEAYPGFAGPVINLGLIELKATRYESANNFFKQAVQRDANSAVANNYLGLSYRNLGRFKEAQAAYQAAIAADANYAAAHLNLGVLYDLYLQQPELALAEYQRYQEILGTPDAKVAGWIKEVTGRLAADKRADKQAKSSEAAP